ncbi:MAG: hypothetical protein ACRD6X_03725 [Pyrinomonadaceae bacterium]
MITVRGKIENGKILALEPIDDEFEGRDVEITFDEKPNGSNGSEDLSAIENDWQRLMDAIERNQISTGIGDLAHQHDHFLYGTPKRED